MSFDRSGPRRGKDVFDRDGIYLGTVIRVTMDRARPESPAALLVLRMLTSLNWSTLKPRVRRIPTSLVQVASHERILLAVTEAELDAGALTGYGERRG